MIKDLDLALAAAAENDVELPVTKSVREFYQKAADAGHAQEDFSAVTLELERMAGI
jgi:3-hydroxyisobutyrate dehydrogenase-like beta-hydroxyacid dehydrogenase